jgi:leucyl-tRNA synthetase
MSEPAAKRTQRRFDHRAIDAKWQAQWAKANAFATPRSVDPSPKQYILDMFPYPSGAGLHVGHPRGFVATDVIARLRRAQGYDVLHPMGWDAFGLPAENYAIKTGIHPAQTTQTSINRFREQIRSIGLGYDWSRELSTADPTYYRWTQWIFLQLFKRGLAYQKEAPVNWCPKDQTVLANEQVVNGGCDRCGTPVVQKKLTQWFFKTTAYADELLTALDDLNWPEPIKTMQRNWIGKSTGALIHFPIERSDQVIDVFTTRIDTLYSAAFLILAPEHELVDQLATDDHRSAVEAYRRKAAFKTPLERTVEKEQTGVFTGSFAINPINQQRLPIWIADFVIDSYGTGAVFADAHDERDFAMAKRYAIPLTISVVPEQESARAAVESLEQCFTGDGILVNSGPYTALTSAEARERMIADLSGTDAVERSTQYKLRDWLVSRQRYWGAPIPIVHCPGCGPVPVPEDQLPVTLPTDVDFLPTGESPLARSASFKQTPCPSCGEPAERDVDTMDTFVDSSWYYLRYLSAHDDTQAIDLAAIDRWLPVNVYVGGAEHAILHLLYARFMTKALADILGFDIREPFKRLINVGLVRADDGRKMSKSLGNVVNPDDVIDEFGADTLRAYELFMGPFSDSMPWSTRSIVGVRRWLDRIWQLQGAVSLTADPDRIVHQQLARTVAKVTDDSVGFKFNTAISALMELTNTLTTKTSISTATMQTFLRILEPIAPHLANELWERLDLAGECTGAPWPMVDPASLTATTVTIAVQVGGKTRGTMTVPAATVESELVALARLQPNVQRHLAAEPRRTIVVPGRIINFIP